MKAKRTFAFVFFVSAGIILGSLVSSLTADIPYLSFLSCGKSFGIPASSPLILDLAVVKISLAAQISVNIAQIIFITAGILIYRKAASKL